MPAGMSDAQWRWVGRLLHSAVEGTVRLMAVRASTKHELRAEVTVIQSRDNNPLKFSPDANTALGYLLQAPTRGFLDGPAAMDDAMHDLVGHAIGTVAGMRAAIDGMLGRFAPQALESMLTSKSVLDSLLPAQRKARLWDLYVQHHQSIRNEAQEDFHSLFGRAFLAAYEQQIEQLKRGTPPA
jgi:FHA domain-containing protein